MQGKVEICGVNTSRLHVLSQVEMDALLRRAQAGDEDAREKLIEGNLRLVLSVIQRFDKRGENPDDLFQVGCIGLIKAISNFDPDKQVRFSTYGVPMIAGEVRRYLRDNSVIRVSRSIRDVAYRVLQCKEALITRLGREPTLEEISKELEIPLEEVSRALDAVCAPASLYDPVYSDGGDPLTVMDQVRDTKNTEDGWTTGKSKFFPCGFTTGRPRWRWPPPWVSLRRRCPGWKRAPLAPCANPSAFRRTVILLLSGA